MVQSCSKSVRELRAGVWRSNVCLIFFYFFLGGLFSGRIAHGGRRRRRRRRRRSKGVGGEAKAMHPAARQARSAFMCKGEKKQRQTIRSFALLGFEAVAAGDAAGEGGGGGWGTKHEAFGYVLCSLCSFAHKLWHLVSEWTKEILAFRRDRRVAWCCCSCPQPERWGKRRRM